MAVEINGKVYRNLPEQVKKNQEDIESLEASSIKEEIVDELPEIGEENVVYLVSNGAGYNQYVWDPETETFKIVGGNLLNIDNDSGLNSLRQKGSTLGSGATGSQSLAIGLDTSATSSNSMAQGWITTASGLQSHAEGMGNTASGINAHAEGQGNTASGENSHAEGYGCTASNIEAHAEGYTTQAVGNYAHSEGQYTIAHADISHTEGVGNVVGDLTQVAVRDRGQGGKAIGLGNLVLGTYAFAGGCNNLAKGDYSISAGEGANNWANPDLSENAVSQYDPLQYTQCNANFSTAIQGAWIGFNSFSAGTIPGSIFGNSLQVGDIIKLEYSTGLVKEVSVINITYHPTVVVNQDCTCPDGTTWVKASKKVNPENITSGSALGKGSVVLGRHNYATEDYQVVIGKYNNCKTDDIFEIGVGPNNLMRVNGLEVTKLGHVNIPTGGLTVSGQIQSNRSGDNVALKIGNTTLTENELIALKALL